MKLSTFAGLAVACLLTSSAAGMALAGSLVGSPPPPPVARDTPPDTGPASSLLAVFQPARDRFDAGATVRVEGRLGHATMAAGRSAKTFLHLDLHASEDLLAAETASTNLSIVIDRSRSMKGQRMENALAAARGMIGRLREGDMVSVVVYNTQSTVLVPPTTITARSRSELGLQLRSIEARGHTCISCGVQEGLAQLQRGQGAVSRMLLLSDGQANTGIRNPEGFERLAEQARGRGVTISSLGVDVDYDERLLLAVAQASNGRHYFVRDPSGLARVFDEELRSLHKTVASGVEAVIDLGPGVEITKVFDRGFSRQGRALVVPFGAFAAGDRKSLLVEVQLPRGVKGLREVADVKLRYRDLTTDPQGEGACEGQLAVRLTDDAGAVSPLDPLVEARLARAETSAALREANEAFAAGDVGRAQDKLRSTRGRIHKRRSASRPLAKKSQRKRFDDAFDGQFEALDRAGENFEQAQKVAPSAPAASPEGKASVRSNADALSGLGL
ncbi:MAG: VWA domain-containing protein [Nannocystaceae bacterium]|nr:VWA domain-containing protein [Nannocystaceae bacterium]